MLYYNTRYQNQKGVNMIYIVRHGETDRNVEGILRGSAHDDEINEVGIKQAKEIGKQLANVKFDICYCSPMSRTRQTYEQISNCPLVLDKRILPIQYDGSLIGKSISVTAKGPIDYWERNNKKLSEESESVLEFEARVFSFFDEIVAKHANQNVLVVTHSSTCKPVKGYFLGIPAGNSYSCFHTENGEIIKGDKRKT